MGEEIQLRTTNTHAEINDRYNDDFIPGTFNIYTNVGTAGQEDAADDTEKVKMKGSIILMPQPCDSCNDPLNWTKARKLVNFAILAVITGFTAATSNDAGAAQDDLNAKYNISYDAMNVGAGVLFAGIALGTFFMTPLASIYGRKITYILCILLGLGGSFWFGKSDRVADTIWSQLFVGLSECCAEAQVQLSLGDLYFQHQLGSVLTVYILATSVGTFLGPMFAGFIETNMGFRWIGWFGGILSGVLLVIIILFLDETYFDRSLFNKSLRATLSHTKNAILSERLSINPEKHHVGPETIDEKSSTNGSSDATSVNTYGASDPPKPYWKRVAIITPATNIRGTGFVQYFKQLLMLTKVFLYPPVIFSGFVWGIQDALLTFYITIEEDTYSDDPYNYSSNKVAIMNVPTLIGSVIGCIYAGILSDYFCIWMAKRNRGVQEAEYRLVFLIIPAIICPIGLICFGIGTDRQWDWVANYICLGIIGFGFGSSGDVSMGYLMDAYPDMVIEMMCGVAVINNLCGCIFTFACSPMLDALGNSKGLGVMAAIEFVIMISAIPMMYFGKRTRIWTKDWYLEFCTLRDAI